MTSVNVRTQGDDEIETHILSVVDSETLKAEEALAKQVKGVNRRPRTHRRLVGQQLGLAEDKGTSQQQHDVEEEEDVESVPRPLSHANISQQRQSESMMIDEDEIQVEEHDKENTGRALFGFTAGVRKGKSTQSMMKKAMEEQEQAAATKELAPSARRKRGRPSKQKDNAKVDHAKRQRIQRQMELLKDNQQSDAEDNATDTEEEEEEEEEDEEEEKNDTRQRDDSDTEDVGKVDDAPGYERYFQDLHGKSMTSNNTMSKLAVLEPAEFNELLEGAPKKHSDDIQQLVHMHERHYPQWFFELNAGFNLLFYGYGSKRRLLNKFAQEILTDGPLLVINGFFPSITIKDILNKITMGALPEGFAPSSTSTQEIVTFICDYFASDERIYDKLYLVIHNIDGNNLRNDRTQTALSILAHAPNIHLVASIDHINAPLLWDSIKTSRFNWVWHDATTYDDYIVETSFENTLLVRTSEMGGARGAQYVLRSLTSNARGVFRVLAESQLIEMEMANFDHARGNDSVGLTYSRYYDMCREGFFVSTDVAFRSQLTEFHDHHIINSKKLLDGTEVFFIPLDKMTLTGLLEEMAD
ncbi:hypothetical protein O0I10_012889 [Lichtheimia ornata]|uniref:Origin recognition complex subunit 2 n=1 Tax=Lichtheimia ornata TaxID=688661 RepID=A0AAD7USN6_9FUNG|nr:uncharacterized protein O0I10_012889 [Lichtheimia ornata]KAJ8651551.1 hypothetical protein O0I10_012889 [Lichtheimia ornata]